MILNEEERLKKRQLSYSQITTWQRCRMKWKFTYVDDLAPREKTIPLMVGDLTHLLRERFLLDKLTGEDISSLFNFVKERYPNEEDEILHQVTLEAATLVNEYIQQYEADGTVQIVSPEVHLVKDFDTFSMYARVDGLAKVQGTEGIWREELKTTSRKDSAYLGGLRTGLQTGISIWLMEELLEEQVRGTVFSLIVKTKVPQVYITPVMKAPWLSDFARETCFKEAEAMQRGEIWRSSQCMMYNRECSFMKICRHDTPENRKAFYISRSEDRKRVDEMNP